MTDGTPGALREIGRQNPHLAMAMEIAADEIERLRDVIDCGTNAIRDALAVSGGDLERIAAMQRRMRHEMSVCKTGDG